MKAELIAVVFAGVSLAGIVHAASGRTVTVTNKDRTVTLAKGDTLMVRLPANPTTGFSWVVLSIDSERLSGSGKGDYQQHLKRGPVVGAGGTETFTFTATAAGIGHLAMGYERPWEKDVAPAKKYTLTVTIK